MSESVMPFAKSPETVHEDLRGFPPGTVQAVLGFRENPAPATLDLAMRAVLEFYLPRQARRSLTGVPGTTRLREDLGVDSLALAEAIFKWDDLFAVPIETREAAGLQTLDEMLAFLSAKMGLAAEAGLES